MRPHHMAEGSFESGWSVPTSTLWELLLRGPLAVHILRRLGGARCSPKGPFWHKALLPPEVSSLEAGWYGVTQLRGSIPVDTSECNMLTSMFKT